jgi:hypothetical protein
MDSSVFMRSQEPDLERITVRLWKGERDSVYGEVILPDKASAGTPIPVSGPKSPAEALAVAVVISRRLNLNIAVVDHENLWNPKWGILT